MNHIGSALVMLIALGLSACGSIYEEGSTVAVEQGATPEIGTERIISVDGEELIEGYPFEIISWKCGDYGYGEETIVELGRLVVVGDYEYEDVFTDEYFDSIAGHYEVIPEDLKNEFSEEEFAEFMVESLGFVLYDGTNDGTTAYYARNGLDHLWFWGLDNSEFTFEIRSDGTGIYNGELFECNKYESTYSQGYSERR